MDEIANFINSIRQSDNLRKMIEESGEEIKTMGKHHFILPNDKSLQAVSYILVNHTIKKVGVTAKQPFSSSLVGEMINNVVKKEVKYNHYDDETWLVCHFDDDSRACIISTGNKTKMVDFEATRIEFYPR